MAKHPDQITEASVAVLDDECTFKLELKCSTPDLAEVLFNQVARQLKAGTLDLRGRGGRVTKIVATREVPL